MGATIFGASCVMSPMSWLSMATHCRSQLEDCIDHLVSNISSLAPALSWARLLVCLVASHGSERCLVLQFCRECIFSGRMRFSFRAPALSSLYRTCCAMNQVLVKS